MLRGTGLRGKEFFGKEEKRDLPAQASAFVSLIRTMFTVYKKGIAHTKDALRFECLTRTFAAVLNLL
jgi:hypothetical protein